MDNFSGTVIFLNDTGYINGGTASVVFAEIFALHRRGVRVVLLCAVGPVAPVLIDEKVPVVCLDQQEIANDSNRLRAVAQGLWNFKAATALSKLLDQASGGQSVVHVHGWTKSLSSSVVRAAAGRAAIILTLHDYFAACPAGGFYDYVAGQHCSKVALSMDCVLRGCDRRGRAHKLYRVARQVVQRSIGGMPTHVGDIIYISDFSLSHLKNYLPQRARLHFLPNPMTAFKGSPMNVGENEAFLFVGRMSPEKGSIVFADAATRAGVQAIFAGSGEDEAAVYAACPSADLLGWVDLAGLENAYSRARALVVPSLWYETFGLVVLEAALRGIPAIVSDSCAARDLIVDGETGLLYRNGDVADLSEKLRCLSDNPQLALEMGQAAWQRYWSDPFDIDRHVDGLMAVYSQAMMSQLH